jgi:hypothetical protein
VIGSRVKGCLRNLAGRIALIADTDAAL